MTAQTQKRLIAVAGTAAITLAIFAANATIGLMEPTGNGIGGDLFAIVYWAKTGELFLEGYGRFS